MPHRCKYVIADWSLLRSVSLLCEQVPTIRRNQFASRLRSLCGGIVIKKVSLCCLQWYFGNFRFTEWFPLAKCYRYRSHLESHRVLEAQSSKHHADGRSTEHFLLFDVIWPCRRFKFLAGLHKWCFTPGFDYISIFNWPKHFDAKSTFFQTYWAGCWKWGFVLPSVSPLVYVHPALKL